MPIDSPSSSRPILIGIVVVAALYFGRAIFIPLALALLLCVALIPVVRRLERWGAPRVVAVLTVVLAVLGFMAGFGILLVDQALALASDLPRYEANLRAKVQSLSDGSGTISRAAETIHRVMGENGLPSAATPAAPAAPTSGPLDTLLVAFETLADPLATVLILILFASYVLLSRDDLRDRFIRLAGGRDLNRATFALAETGERVSRYLLTQLALNAIFGVLMGAGLWAIGVPSAALWGLLSFVLRFVPYVGAPVALLFPLTVSLAAEEGWTLPILVLALFVAVEILTTNVLEVMMQGHATGLSPLALLVSSALWTVVWGPLGLVIGPPVTTCLLIAGRHVPQWGGLVVLLGREPALEPRDRFYQRLLAEDAWAAEQEIDLQIAASGADSLHDDLFRPAVEQLRQDWRRGAVDHTELDRIATRLRQFMTEVADPPPEEQAQIVIAGAGGPLDALLAESLAIRLQEGGVAARVVKVPESGSPLTGPSLRAGILVSEQYPSARRIRRAAAVLKAALGRQLPVGILCSLPVEGETMLLRSSDDARTFAREHAATLVKAA